VVLDPLRKNYGVGHVAMHSSADANLLELLSDSGLPTLTAPSPLPAFLDQKLHYMNGPAGDTGEVAQWLVRCSHFKVHHRLEGE